MDSKFVNDKHFEERIVQAIVVDHNFADQMMEVLDLDYFNLEHLREITKIIFDYNKKYHAFPSFKLLATIVKEIENDVLKEKIMSYFIKISKEPLNGDMEYVKETVLDFCKRRSLSLALESSLDLIEDKKYDQIIGTVQKALLAGSERDVGHIYLDGLEKRMELIKRNPIPTPWPQINNLMGGGLSGGELGMMMASSKKGKSHMLVDIGAHAASLGYNVAHYTFELSDVYVGKRYDSRIANIPFDTLHMHKQEVQDALNKIKGQIVIKSFPMKSKTVLAIKNHHQQLVLRDKKPDLILVDYVDLMRSTREYNDKRLEEEAATEELRGLSQELGVPIWSPTQSNRSGLDVEVLTQKHIAECFGKYMVVDFFMTMNRDKDLGNFFIAGSRLGPDSIKYSVLVDTSRSRFQILSEDQLPENEEVTAQAALKKKFEDLRQEGKI